MRYVLGETGEARCGDAAMLSVDCFLPLPPKTFAVFDTLAADVAFQVGVKRDSASNVASVKEGMVTEIHHSLCFFVRSARLPLLPH